MKINTRGKVKSKIRDKSIMDKRHNKVRTIQRFVKKVHVYRIIIMLTANTDTKYSTINVT